MAETVHRHLAEDWCAEIYVEHVSIKFIEELQLGSVLVHRTRTLTDSLKIAMVSDTGWRIADQIGSI